MAAIALLAPFFSGIVIPIPVVVRLDFLSLAFLSPTQEANPARSSSPMTPEPLRDNIFRLLSGRFSLQRPTPNACLRASSGGIVASIVAVMQLNRLSFGAIIVLVNER